MCPGPICLGFKDTCKDLLLNSNFQKLKKELRCMVGILPAGADHACSPPTLAVGSAMTSQQLLSRLTPTGPYFCPYWRLSQPEHLKSEFGSMVLHQEALCPQKQPKTLGGCTRFGLNHLHSTLLCSASVRQGSTMAKDLRGERKRGQG